MKPHESTLSVMRFDKERRCLVEGHGQDQLMVAVLRNYDSADWEALLSAAPDLVRALRGVCRLDRVPACWCQPGRDIGVYGHAEECAAAMNALKKAGVIP